MTHCTTLCSSIYQMGVHEVHAWLVLMLLYVSHVSLFIEKNTSTHALLLCYFKIYCVVGNHTVISAYKLRHGIPASPVQKRSLTTVIIEHYTVTP